MRSNHKFGLIPVLTLFLIFSEVVSYEIGAGDVLEVEMWQQPELSTTVTVYSDGTIILPVIGSVKVEGMTPAQASELISRRLSAFNPRISQVMLKVVEFNSRSIFVLGEVRAPGRYSFESIPDLLAVLSEAGGPTEEAALSEIFVLRANSSSSRGLVVALEKAINERNLGSLPRLKPGDAIWVPSRSGYIGENRVSIFGEVNTPGVYTIGSDTDMLDLILLAGGPTEEADLGRVRLIRRTRGSTAINLDSYVKRGERDKIPQLNPDDLVIVSKRSHLWSTLWNGFRETVMVLGTIAGVYLVYQSIGD